MDKIKLIQMQLALFFKDLELRPDRLGSKVDSSLDIFDMMPTNIPVPPDAPSEMPVTIMSSSNGKFNCNISRSRLNFIINFGNSDDALTPQVESFFSYVKTLSDVVLDEKEVIRFGIVAQYFLKDKYAVKRIDKKYFRDDFSNYEELNVRFNKRSEINGLTMNDVVDIGKAISKINGIEHPGVLIQRDVNNIPVSGLDKTDIEELTNEIKIKFMLSSINLLV